MRILKLFDGDYPWDVRVEKVTDTLLAVGHAVGLVCRNRGGLPRRDCLPNGLQIFRTPTLGAQLDFPAFFNPIWVSAAFAAARAMNPDLILARDLPLTPLGLALARRLGVPVVADLAEPYPESLRAHFAYQEPALADWVVRSPRLADAIERWVLPRIDHAIVVCPEAGERLVLRGLPADRWTEVRNTVDPDRFRPRGVESPAVTGFEGRFRILFSGLLSGDRGVEIGLAALYALRLERPGEFAFIVTGEGPVRQALERKAASLGIASDVRFTGWVPYQELPDLIAACDVGILPFHRCPHIDASLANKLFEYMTLGLPVIASSIAPMRRIIVDAHCGILVPSSDAAELANAIRSLKDSPNERERFGKAGMAASASLYRWQHDASRLRSVLESVQLGSSKDPTRAVSCGAAPLLRDWEGNRSEGACP